MISPVAVQPRNNVMRYTPHEMHACGVHAHGTHAHKMHAREMHAHEVHAYKVHAHKVHAREVRASETIVSGLHRHRRYRRFLPTRVWPERVGTFPASAGITLE